MSMTDPIADMLTRIRNAQMVGKTVVGRSVLQAEDFHRPGAEDEGYIDGFTVRENEGKPELEIGLKYYADKPVIEKIERVSTPGLRIYKGRNELPRVMNGLGVAIVSTSKGVMTIARRAPPASAAKFSASSPRIGHVADRKISRNPAKGVEATLAAEALSIKGPLGTLSQRLRGDVGIERTATSWYSRLSKTQTSRTPCRERCARSPPTWCSG